MKTRILLILPVATVLLLAGCAGPGFTLSQGGTVYYSTLESERAKMAQQRMKNAKDVTKQLEKIKKDLEKQVKVDTQQLPAEYAKQQALREEIARLLQQRRAHRR